VTLVPLCVMVFAMAAVYVALWVLDKRDLKDDNRDRNMRGPLGLAGSSNPCCRIVFAFFFVRAHCVLSSRLCLCSVVATQELAPAHVHALPHLYAHPCSPRSPPARSVHCSDCALSPADPNVSSHVLNMFVCKHVQGEDFLVAE
jgi:hypothetical protein